MRTYASNPLGTNDSTDSANVVSDSTIQSAGERSLESVSGLNALQFDQPPASSSRRRRRAASRPRGGENYATYVGKPRKPG